MTDPGKHQKNWQLMVVTAIIPIIILGGAGGYYFYGPCGTQKVETANKDFKGKISRYLSAIEVAGTMPRIALAGPVSSMQDIKTQTEELIVPACMEYARAELVLGMDSGIRAFLLFMAQESEGQVARQFDAGALHLANANEEILRIMACAPFCAP